LHRAPERLDLIPVVFIGLLFLGVAGNLPTIVLADAGSDISWRRCWRDRQVATLSSLFAR